MPEVEYEAPRKDSRLAIFYIKSRAVKFSQQRALSDLHSVCEDD